MIEFFLGKTGSGKSYLALKRIVEFLTESPDGYVRTNLAINLGELNSYLKEKYPELEVDVVGRVFPLADSECRQFYLYREPGNFLSPVSKADEQALRFPDFDSAAMKSQQILYVIDEAHISFDAREWAQVGPTLNFFASQHRKFRSDIIFVTQFLDQVEKRLRNHATKFQECVNWSARRWAFWKMPSYFRVAETYKAPPCPSEHTDTYAINPALAKCYDTTAGVGVRGGRAPEKIRRKGWPFWTLPASLCCLIVALYYLPDLVVNPLLQRVGGKPSGAVASQPGLEAETKKETGAAASFMRPADITATPNREKSAPFDHPVQKPQRVEMKGWAVRGDGKALVVLTDRRRLTETDAEFNGLERRGNAVWVSGEKLWMAEPQWSAPREVAKVSISGPLGDVAASSSSYQGEAVVPTSESLKSMESAKAFTMGVGVAGHSANVSTGGKATARRFGPTEK